MKDSVIMEMLATDPQKGMTLLMKAYMGFVYTVVRHRLWDSSFCQADVESCVADTFSDFYCDRAAFDPEKGSLRGWLCALATHNALDLLRKKKRENVSLSLQDPFFETVKDDFILDEALEEKEKRQALLSAIRQLPFPDREILLRKYYYGQPSRTVAEALHMTVSSVDTRTHRIIQKLRKQFGGKT